MEETNGTMKRQQSVTSNGIVAQNLELQTNGTMKRQQSVTSNGVVAQNMELQMTEKNGIMKIDINTAEAGVDTGPRLGMRHLMGLLLCLAGTVGYSMRIDMSIAIVAMTDNETDLAHETFDWDSSVRNTILSSFFWGYVVTQIPAGVMAQALGAKWLLLAGIGINSICTLFTPLAAINSGWGAVCALRVIQGLTQATLVPCTHAVLSVWIPPSERATMAAVSYAGGQVGTIIALIFGGLLADSAGGWPSIFYLMGSLGLVWCLLWVIFSSSTPAEHRFISKAEVKFIESTFSHVASEKKFDIPWWSLFTSLPVWSLIISHMCQNFGYWTLLTELPLFMDKALGFDMSSNGVVTSIPYIAMTLLSFLFGYIADVIVKKQWTTVLVSRKLFNSIGFWGPAIGLVVLTFVSGQVGAVVVLTFAVGLNAGVYVGFQVNHIDLSPNFASTMMGITNCAATIMSIVGPLAVTAIVEDESNEDEWHVVFYIAAGIYFIGNVIYLLLGTTDLQPWDDPNYKRTKSSTVDKDQDEKQRSQA